MSNSTVKLIALFGVLFAVVAVVATALATFVYLDKRKSEQELEHYLDCSIQ